MYFWGLIGFALGTLILLGPVRWWASYCRERGFSEGFESGGVVTLILVLVAASFSLALWATTEWVRTRSFILRFVLPVVALGLAYYAYSYWMNPDSLSASMAEEQVASQHFTFGPFPDEARLRSLKGEGYTAVISLLHPAVVPFEPQLIDQERAAAERAGIEMIHLPMLPWVSDNKESLDRLREIAESKTGRYYIHCYLGEDRVNVARRIIEMAGDGVPLSGGDTRKSLKDKKSFERGPIHALEGDVYLTPFPTDEELTSYFMTGKVASVIAMLDPQVKEDAEWIAKERSLFGQFGVEYEIVPVGPERYDPDRILHAVELARKAKKPVVVHAFFPPDHQFGAVAQAFLQAYLSGEPPLPPAIFGTMDVPISVVAPNVAVGPVLSGRDWKRIRGRGVRVVVFIGATDMTASSREASTTAGLEIRSVDDVGSLVEMVASGGPYYVCGPDLESARQRIESTHGPAIPRAKRRDS